MRAYLSVADIADELGCSVREVEALIDASELPRPIRGGLISRAAIDAYRRHARGPSPVAELPARRNEELRGQKHALPKKEGL